MQDKTHALVLYGDGSAAQHVQAHADARLIAAAPELYDELENARAIIAGEAPQYGEAIARIDASLAKARGGP
jgi:hypothetical protein